LRAALIRYRAGRNRDPYGPERLRRSPPRPALVHACKAIEYIAVTFLRADEASVSQLVQEDHHRTWVESHGLAGCYLMSVLALAVPPSLEDISNREKRHCKECHSLFYVDAHPDPTLSRRR
jgi:hypothetical protein